MDFQTSLLARVAGNHNQTVARTAPAPRRTANYNMAVVIPDPGPPDTGPRTTANHNQSVITFRITGNHNQTLRSSR